jgi:hypothetical protein
VSCLGGYISDKLFIIPWFIFGIAIFCFVTAFICFILSYIVNHNLDYEAKVLRLNYIMIDGVIFIVSFLVYLPSIPVTPSPHSLDKFRLAQIETIETAMEMYFNEVNHYPECNNRVALKDISRFCNAPGLNKWITDLDNFVDPLRKQGRKLNLCLPTSSEPCEYSYVSNDGKYYEILFYKQQDNKDGKGGLKRATPTGIAEVNNN